MIQKLSTAGNNSNDHLPPSGIINKYLFEYICALPVTTYSKAILNLFFLKPFPHIYNGFFRINEVRDLEGYWPRFLEREYGCASLTIVVPILFYAGLL